MGTWPSTVQENTMFWEFLEMRSNHYLLFLAGVNWNKRVWHWETFFLRTGIQLIRTSETGQYFFCHELTSSLVPSVSYRFCSGRVQKFLSTGFLCFSLKLIGISEALEPGRATLRHLIRPFCVKGVGRRDSSGAASAVRAWHLIRDIWASYLASFLSMYGRKKFKWGRREWD